MTDNAASSSAKLLRGGAFVQPNTATQAPAVLQNDELHAEDLHAATRISAIMLRPSIHVWRASLDAAAGALAEHLKMPAAQIKSARHPDIKVVDFKPAQGIDMKGLHKVDGTLNFRYVDEDAAAAGVYQPKVVASSSSSSAATGAAVGGNSSNADSTTTRRVMWAPHELPPQDRAAYDALRQAWRDQRFADKNKSGGGASDKSVASAKPVVAAAGVRIRQREHTTTAAGATDGPTAPPQPNLQTTTAATAAADDDEDDIDALLARANEAIARS